MNIFSVIYLYRIISVSFYIYKLIYTFSLSFSQHMNLFFIYYIKNVLWVKHKFGICINAYFKYFR